MLNQNIRICLKSYNPTTLTNACNKIIDTLQQSGGTSSGVIPLPTRLKKYCVLRSPHVDKKSREQFQTKVHKRVVDIVNSTPKTVDETLKANAKLVCPTRN